MIDFDAVTVTYHGAAAPVLCGVDLHVEEGALAVVVGPTGSGKSTLLGAVNGLVPHFSGGTLAGRVTVDGRDTRTHPPRQLADTVGVCGQDPVAGFVTDTVEEELAYAMEQLGVPPAVMRTRVEDTLDLLGIAELRDRPLHRLSGGQQQRVAIGSVLTAGPRVLVLDEPTSALDPTAAEEVLAAITRLVHDLGVTVLLAEHRLERVVQYADTVVEVHGDGRVSSGLPSPMLQRAAVAPPVVELGRMARWSPLPLSVRDARRVAGPLRDRLGAARPDAAGAGGRSDAAGAGGLIDVADAGRRSDAADVGGRRGRGGDRSAPALEARGVVVRFGPLVAVGGVDLALPAGHVTALMGRNGSGKSSLLWALQGSGPRHAGTVGVGGVDPASVPPAAARRLVGLVPQTPADLLYLPTVAKELDQAERDGVGAGAASDAPPARALLDRLAPGIADGAHPRDLSEGQRLALVIALQLTAAPPVVLLDEPTRGLDYPAKRQLGRTVALLASEGRAVLVATHDVEWVAATADSVAVMAAGEIVAHGPTADIVTASPTYAPQVAKILAPLPFLTVDQVDAALAGTAP